MARAGNTNYTASGTDFEKATADSDRFDAADVQKLAAAVDEHDHSSTRGLGVKRVQSGATPALSGEVQVTGDTLRFYGTQVNTVVVSPAQTANIGDLQVTTDKIGNLQVTAAKIANATITATQLANNAVETAKIADGNVTTAKLPNNVLSADSDGLAKMQDGYLLANATGRAKMQAGFLQNGHVAADAGITLDKLAPGASFAIERHSDTTNPHHILTGTQSRSGVAGTTEYPIAFSPAFKAATTPVVVVGRGIEDASWDASVTLKRGTLTNTGFTLIIRHNVGADITVDAYWIAEGQSV